MASGVKSLTDVSLTSNTSRLVTLASGVRSLTGVYSSSKCIKVVRLASGLRSLTCVLLRTNFLSPALALGH